MFCIKLAGIVVGIENRYEAVKKLCRDYICEDSPSFLVCVGEEDIEREISLAVHPVSRGYAESICIYRAICRRLPEFGAFLFHSAVVECDGESFAFAAASGTGKSTHAELWLKHFGDRARIINGDKPILRFDGERVLACGTPWCGKEGLNINADSPLCAICFIERGEKNEISRINAAQAVMRIFPQILMPQTEGAVDLLFPLLDRMLRDLPCYLLRCNISDEAVTVAYEMMKR